MITMQFVPAKQYLKEQLIIETDKMGNQRPKKVISKTTVVVPLYDIIFNSNCDIFYAKESLSAKSWSRLIQNTSRQSLDIQVSKELIDKIVSVAKRHAELKDDQQTDSSLKSERLADLKNEIQAIKNNVADYFTASLSRS